LDVWTLSHQPMNCHPWLPITAMRQATVTRESPLWLLNSTQPKSKPL
jgi:hypothetical protein